MVVHTTTNSRIRCIAATRALSPPNAEDAATISASPPGTKPKMDASQPVSLNLVHKHAHGDTDADE